MKYDTVWVEFVGAALQDATKDNAHMQRGPGEDV